MSAKKPKRQKYCGPHNPSGVGYVWWQGKQVYFKGHPWMSAESLAAYDRFCREHVEAEIKPGDGDIKTVARLATLYVREAHKKYHGGELHAIRGAVDVLAFLHGQTIIADFGPLALQDVRREMISRGWSRPYVNRQIHRIRRVFEYGVSQQIVRPETIIALATVDSLREGESEAPETDPVEPVEWKHVHATLAECGPVVGAMLRLQMATGLRSINICRMTAAQIDRSEWTWLYVPRKHKTQHLGKVLVVPLGPRAKAAVFPFLFWRDSDAPLFSPQESSRLHHDARIRKAKRPRYGKRKAYKNQEHRRMGAQYTRNAYYQSIRRACKRAGVPPWSPHQLRHTIATDIRAKYGLEAAQAYLGHASLTATQIYAARDLRRAVAIAEEFG